MNQSKRSFLLYRTVSLVVTIAAMLLCTVNLLFFYEKEIGYYQAGSILPVVTNVIIVLGVLFFALFSWFGLRKNPPTYSVRTKSTAGTPYLIIIELLLFSASVFFVGVGSSFDIPLALTGILGAVYFLLYDRKWGSAITHFVCGTAQIVFFALLLVNSYFDIGVQMNAPIKLAFQLGCIGGMLLMLSEIRLFCGYPSPRFSAFSNSCAALFLGVASLPTFVADAFSCLPERSNTLPEFVFLGFFLLALARLSVPSNEEDENPPIPLESDNTNNTDGDSETEPSQD